MVTVVDNTVDAILKDARSPLAVAADAVAEAEEKSEKTEKIEPAAAEVAKEEPPKAAAKIEEPADDVEGPDGLTPKQKREFTAEMQKTIAKKHGRMMGAEEFATDQYNQRVLAENAAAQLRREIERLKGELPAHFEPEEALKEPDRTKFASDAEYANALIDYRVEQRLIKEREANAAKERERAQAIVLAQANERISKARAVVPDFDETVSAVDAEVPVYIAGYMQESELFAELGYHFAKHPEVLEKIKTLSPAKALVEIGKIESKLEPFSGKPEKVVESSNGATPPSQKTGSQAPSPKPRVGAPIVPIASASIPQVEPSEQTAREALDAWQRKRSVDLLRRKRH